MLLLVLQYAAPGVVKYMDQIVRITNSSYITTEAPT